MSGVSEEENDLNDQLAAVISGMFRGLWIKAASCHLSLSGADLSQLGNLNK